jgi:hypothetical protein
VVIVLIVTSSLTRGWVCRLQLLLLLESAVILRFESRGTHDHILLSQIPDSPNFEGQVPVFLSPGTGWPGYTPRHWVPFSSSPTTRRATVEVFDPASIQVYFSLIWHGPHINKSVQLLQAVFSLRYAPKVYKQQTTWRRRPISKHGKKFEISECGHGFRRDPKLRLTVLLSARSNLPDRPRQHPSVCGGEWHSVS